MSLFSSNTEKTVFVFSCTIEYRWKFMCHGCIVQLGSKPKCKSKCSVVNYRIKKMENEYLANPKAIILVYDLNI